MRPRQVEPLACGKTDRLQHGEFTTIESANYPGPYPNRQNCRWRLEIPANSEVALFCDTFDVKRGDFLQIVEGKNLLFRLQATNAHIMWVPLPTPPPISLIAAECPSCPAGGAAAAR